MKRILKAYRELLSILYKEAPVTVIAVFVLAAVNGSLSFISVYASQHVYDDGLRVATGAITMAEYVPYLILLILTIILPPIISELFVFGYATPRCVMILNTSYKGLMLQKLKKMKYEHMENEESMEIIDKAFHRAVFSARHLFPMYVVNTISNLIASIGILYLYGRVRWWLVLTILIPFIIESYLSQKENYNIYDELESYWNQERRYTTLGTFLRSRDYLYEGKLNGSSEYLIDTYKSRLHERNRQYESYYLKHLYRRFTKSNISKIAIIGNIALLIFLYLHGAMSVGTMISLTLAMFGTTYGALLGSTIILRWGGYHINSTDYYGKFFNLSETEEAQGTPSPASCDLEFRDVWFRYPGNDTPYILQGLSFHLRPGEKISIVGENGEGKSTIIKLLLGLFTPDRGDILLDGRPLSQYTQSQRNQIFAPVFQDFMRYSISLKENIAVGDIDMLHNEAAIRQAAEKSLASTIADEHEDGYDTLLGRDFEGGVDLSGGQWQRIAIARALMGDKPFLILDEPTSQLDPMAESRLYSEFQEMASGKSAIFITHRLASTMITDRIIVLSQGHIVEEGNHEQLMKLRGIYYEMFEAQKKWYQHQEVTA